MLHLPVVTSPHRLSQTIKPNNGYNPKFRFRIMHSPFRIEELLYASFQPLAFAFQIFCQTIDPNHFSSRVV